MNDIELVKRVIPTTTACQCQGENCEACQGRTAFSRIETLIRQFPGHRNEAEWNQWLFARDQILGRRST